MLIEGRTTEIDTARFDQIDLEGIFEALLLQ
jgi:hypothetical protein